MSSSARAADPSMEEILASIRRIIADDLPPQRDASARSPLPAPEDESSERSDIGPSRVASPVIRQIGQGDAAVPLPLRPAPREPSLFAEHAAPEPPAETQTVPEQFQPFVDLGAVGDEIEAEVALALRRTPAGEMLSPIEAGPARHPSGALERKDPVAASDGARPLPSFAPPPTPAPSSQRDVGETAAPPPGRAGQGNAHGPVEAGHVPASPAGAPPLPRPSFSFSQPARPSASPVTPPSERLVSPPTNAAVAASFGTLARTIMTNNSRSLEDVVGELLKPMLRSWLDDNLPTIVERLVKAEIERVSRGGR